MDYIIKATGACYTVIRCSDGRAMCRCSTYRNAEIVTNFFNDYMDVMSIKDIEGIGALLRLKKLWLSRSGK